MLEIIEFNYKLFRYRSESHEQGVVYNLRYGTLFIVKGNTKTIIERIINQGSISINTENKAIDFLIQNKVFSRKVER